MILLDYKDRRPIYEQVVSKLEELMLLGAMKENEPLPSVRSLAMELSINPNTIQRAYVELERQGYIYTVKGKGSFVADNTVMKEKRKKEVLLQVSDMIDEAIRNWSFYCKSDHGCPQPAVWREELGEWCRVLVYA